jgi:hypothetical protein
VTLRLLGAGSLIILRECPICWLNHDWSIHEAWLHNPAPSVPAIAWLMLNNRISAANVGKLFKCCGIHLDASLELTPSGRAPNHDDFHLTHERTPSKESTRARALFMFAARHAAARNCDAVMGANESSVIGMSLASNCGEFVGL